MIVRGDIEPGAPILSQALNVSRTPLREALKIFASEELTIWRNQSARVATGESIFAETEAS